MPLVQPVPWIKYQFFDSSGNPLSGGLVYTYAAGTTTPLATYTDHNGNVQNTNPIVLDSGGFANIWVTAASYKISVHNSADVPLYTVDGIPGIGSLISVGDLPPLFTSNLAGGALTFTLSNAAAGSLFGRFAGTVGAPSFGAIGSDKQITYNSGGQMTASDNLLYDSTARTFSLRDAGSSVLRLIAGTAGGQGTIRFGTGTTPSITDLTEWEFVARASSDITFGPPSGPHQAAFLATGGAFGETTGGLRLGEAASAGYALLNDGNHAAGVFGGARIICGSVANPNGNVTAETGSLFITTNGGAGTTLWVKESSPAANTGWVGK